MTQPVDSVTAARVAAWLFVASVAIGIVTGAAAFAFIALVHVGIELLWETLPAALPGVPAWAVTVGVVMAMTLAAAAIIALNRGRPADMGHAEAEYDEHGRMPYRQLPAAVGFSLTSLWSGAAIGPEAPLVDISGGLGTWVAERFELGRRHVRTLSYAGVAGAFGAFFGAAPVGALLAAELISPKSLTISRTSLVAGLGAGASGWVVYTQLGGHSISPILSFDPTTTVTMGDLLLAVPLGVAGCVIGLVYGTLLLRSRLALRSLRASPWRSALVGGAVISLAAILSPWLLFSGQEQAPVLIDQAASIGALALVAIGVLKLVLNVWTLSTAYFGGPIFPAIFAGTSFGLALNLLVPAIPQHVAILGVVAGLVTAAAVAPLSVTVFLALIVDPSLTSVIAIAAVAAFIVRQLVAPTLPGVYRATHALEAEVAAEPEPAPAG
jgi:H+/Cl- antiporter ClcA